MIVLSHFYHATTLFPDKFKELTLRKNVHLHSVFIPRIP
jgi:hypothetical protein